MAARLALSLGTCTPWLLATLAIENWLTGGAEISLSNPSKMPAH